MTWLVPNSAATAGSSGKTWPGSPFSSAHSTLPVRSHTLMCTIEPSTSRLRRTSLSLDICVWSPMRTPWLTSGAPTPRANAAPRTRASFSAVSRARSLATTKLTRPTTSSTRRLPAAKRYIAPRTAEDADEDRRSADASLGADTDQPVPHRHDDRLELRVRVQLDQQGLHVSAAGVQRDAELAGDHVGLETGRQHLEHVLFALRERRQRLRADVSTDQGLEQPGMHDEPAAARGPERVHHLRQRAVLGQQRTCAGVSRAPHQVGVDEGRQDDHPQPWILPGELRGRGDAVSVAEPHVHHDDVRPQGLDHPDPDGDPVGTADELEPVLA